MKKKTGILVIRDKKRYLSKMDKKLFDYDYDNLK